jgi:hypothetical protein
MTESLTKYHIETTKRPSNTFFFPAYQPSSLWSNFKEDEKRIWSAHPLGWCHRNSCRDLDKWMKSNPSHLVHFWQINPEIFRREETIL